jgi:diguanylate cyclase (GGDEF)-like protein
VHANTVRTWTDQGRLRCLRINSRGDRRYTQAELDDFLARAARRAPAIGGPAAATATATEAAASTNPAPREGAATAQPGRVARRVAELCHSAAGLDQLLPNLAESLADAGYERLLFIANDGSLEQLRGEQRPSEALHRQALRAQGPVHDRSRAHSRVVALPVGDGQHLAGTLQLERHEPTHLPSEEEVDLLATIHAQLASFVCRLRREEAVSEQLRRAEMVHAISTDISSQLDLERILSHLLSYVTEHFAADHAGVVRRLPSGSFVFDQAVNISAEFQQAIEHAPGLPLTQQAHEEGRIVAAHDYPDDPRAAPLRRILVREGINTVTAAPLVSDGELLGALLLYHDERRDWSAEDIALLEQLAQMGATALKNARNYMQMATWAAQLQSIQQLGARLTRLNTVDEIGQAIAAELNQLIDYHNVRVYRVEGDEVVPVAWRGEVGEYTGEDGKQLRVKIGQGITGWVARYGVAQYLPDAAADRRTETIPGTEDDLDESLLLAPMLYEDEVIGVIVLAKLGLHQFTGDDLRLLEIYASIAAQAMANADVTEQLRAKSATLERQLKSQRELLRVTESILSTLDAQQLLDEIADRLDSLLHVDNLAVQLYDEPTNTVRPMFARGMHASAYMDHTFPGDFGVSADALHSGEAQLVQDVLADERVSFFDSIGRVAGAMIVAPLRSRDRVRGLLMVNRLGADASFSAEEFELVKLFAGHVSVALNNAEAHRAVELRAETDPLTGLKNHGSLIQHLDHAASANEPYALLMIDLDGFKSYNDAYGHEAGNVVLRQLADVLRSATRESDEVFRYGGDEFAIMLPRTSPAGAEYVADKISRAVRRASPRHGRQQITCSIGIASFPTDGDASKAVLLAADRACYAAKRAGRDGWANASDALMAAVELDTEQGPGEGFGRTAAVLEAS